MVKTGRDKVNGKFRRNKREVPVQKIQNHPLLVAVTRPSEYLKGAELGMVGQKVV